MSKQSNFKKVKVVASATTLVAAVAVLTVGVLALLSDVSTNNGSLRSNAQTSQLADQLDIGSECQAYVNDSSTPYGVGPNSVMIEPDDVVVVKCTVTSYGAKSAWVQDSLSQILSTGSADNVQQLQIVPGGWTRDELLGDDIVTGGLVNTRPALASLIGGLKYGFAGGGGGSAGYPMNIGYFTYPHVIDGVGTSAEVETVSNAESSLIADTANGYYPEMFSGSSYTFAWTIYYDPAQASQDDYGFEFNFSTQTQALQYESNNLAMPAMNDWNVVVTTPIGRS